MEVLVLPHLGDKTTVSATTVSTGKNARYRVQQDIGAPNTPGGFYVLLVLVFDGDKSDDEQVGYSSYTTTTSTLRL